MKERYERDDFVPLAGKRGEEDHVNAITRRRAPGRARAPSRPRARPPPYRASRAPPTEPCTRPPGTGRAPPRPRACAPSASTPSPGCTSPRRDRTRGSTLVVRRLPERLADGEREVEAFAQGNILHPVHRRVKRVPHERVRDDGAEDQTDDGRDAEAHEREERHGRRDHLHDHHPRDVVLERGAAVLGILEHRRGLGLEPLRVRLQGHVVQGLRVVLDVTAAVALRRDVRARELAVQVLHPVRLVELGVLVPAVRAVLVEGHERVHRRRGEDPSRRDRGELEPAGEGDGLRRLARARDHDALAARRHEGRTDERFPERGRGGDGHHLVDMTEVEDSRSGDTNGASGDSDITSTSTRESVDEFYAFVYARGGVRGVMTSRRFG
eukprot:31125-Pelagococcus_subviridis.AAC.22